MIPKGFGSIPTMPGERGRVRDAYAAMIHHVSLECARPDADAHDAFWRALGFVPVPPPESLADRAAWYERGGTQIHLLWRDEPIVAPAGHVAVIVDDPAATGLELDERAQHWGAPRYYATAPGGHTVELFATPPQSQS